MCVSFVHTDIEGWRIEAAADGRRRHVPKPRHIVICVKLVISLIFESYFTLFMLRTLKNVPSRVLVRVGKKQRSV